MRWVSMSGNHPSMYHAALKYFSLITLFSTLGNKVVGFVFESVFSNPFLSPFFKDFRSDSENFRLAPIYSLTI